MTILSASRSTPKQVGDPIPARVGRGMAVDIGYKGGMAAVNAAGFLAPAGLAASDIVCGRFLATYDNSAGAAGDISGEVEQGVFRWANGDSIVAADVGSPCYASDDQTVTLSDSAGTRPFAGIIVDVDTSGVWVLQGIFLAASASGTAAQSADIPRVYAARGASTADVANLAAFTVANDGITLVAGDVVLLKDQNTASQNGLYTVGVVGGGTAPLTRPTFFNDAAEVAPGSLVHVSEGTANADSWLYLATNEAIVVGTTALSFTALPGGFGLAAALADVTKAAESAGTSLLAARIDHKHDISTAAPGATGEANAEGSATSLARSDHVHAEHSKSVRYVMTTNVAALATFTVLQDGVTGVEGDLVLLANQTTGAESGVYVLGAVAGGNAPLTRAAWMPAAAVLRSGYTVHVESGTLNAASNWFISTAGAITIGTTAHAWYPESITQSVVLVAGTATLTNVPVLSITKTGWAITRRIANTSNLTVGGYCVSVAGANGVTAGTVGTASVVIEATVGAGTINNADISTLQVSIVNR